MASFGKNMKLLVARDHRRSLHAVLTEALGCKSASPMDDFSVYIFEDAFNLGVYFVAEDETLSVDDQLKAPWLELLVDDIGRCQEVLKQLEVNVVPYARDPEHVYYQLPGGPVFRLGALD